MVAAFFAERSTIASVGGHASFAFKAMDMFLECEEILCERDDSLFMQSRGMVFWRAFGRMTLLPYISLPFSRTCDALVALRPSLVEGRVFLARGL